MEPEVEVTELEPRVTAPGLRRLERPPGLADAAPAALPVPPVASKPADSNELVLAVATEANRTRFAVGERIKLSLRANRDAYVYCYIQDENSRITRFYPNRFTKDALLQAGRVLDLPGRRVAGGWLGTYASAAGRWRLTDRPADAVRIVVVTSGTGASTAFGIAEETIADLYGPA